MKNQGLSLHIYFLYMKIKPNKGLLFKFNSIFMQHLNYSLVDDIRRREALSSKQGKALRKRQYEGIEGPA